MAMFARAKRVSDPLDDNAKARFTGYASSGSEHDGDHLFSGPIHAFLDVLDTDRSAEQIADYNKGADSTVDIVEMIRGLFDPLGDPFVLRLRSDVARATSASERTRADRSTQRRSVMGILRECGYNAGVCKAEWGTSGSSLTGGSYEYIDVVGPGGWRYVVDPWFAAEFEVARATEEYAALVAGLPRAAVARGEEVGRAVGAMAEAARRSMKSRGLHLPPWRKRRYMMAKWFGPYRRTVNVGPAPVAAVTAGGEMIKCRAVGFGAIKVVNEEMV